MGLFLQTVILPNCKESLIKTAVEQVEERTNIGLIAADCLYKELNDGVNILLNRHCFGYEELAKELSLCITQPVLLLYIYDDDFWGYFFYENGNELDRFNPMPDYFEDVSEEERESFSGNSKIISKYFNVNEEDIKNYLIPWNMENREKAYEDDTCDPCSCWQMADFMKKLGYLFEWD